MTITNLDIYASLVKSIDAQLDTDKPMRVRSYDTFKGIGIDSLDMLCVMADIENEYSIDIPDDAVSIENTVKEAADSIFCVILNK